MLSCMEMISASYRAPRDLSSWRRIGPGPDEGRRRRTAAAQIASFFTRRTLPFSANGARMTARPLWVGPRSRNLHSSSSPRPPVMVGDIAAASLPMDRELLHDLVAGLITVGVAMGSLKFWDELAKRDVFDTKVSRKLVHISIGHIFMLMWPLFGNGHVAPYIAAFAVAMNGLRVLAVGHGLMVDEAMVKSMTRAGDPKELTKGPFYYAVTITMATICLWRTSPLAPVIISTLCAGDGFADLVGRAYGSIKLPYNATKSYVGSVAMCSLGFVFSILFQLYFSGFGYYEFSSKLVLPTLLVSFFSTIVESLPVSTRLDDNLTVPFTSFVVGSLLF